MKEPLMIMLDNQSQLNTSVRSLADKVNKKRQQEIFDIYSKNTIFDAYVQKAKAYGTFEKGNKSKSMRKIATFPVELDAFFTKVYGENYYKDPDFFTKVHPEWLVIDKLKL